MPAIKDEKHRKVATSLTFFPEDIEAINLMTRHVDLTGNGRGDGFSTRVSWVIRDYMKLKSLLVIYTDIIAMEQGNPRIFHPGARRLWSCSGFLHGWGEALDHPDWKGKLETILKPIKKLNPQIASLDLAPKLREAGFTVQIVHEPEADLYDIWIADPEAGSITCERCPRIKKILDIVTKDFPGVKHGHHN